MHLIDTIAALRKELDAARAAGRTVGLVPTMGYLHAGHRSLMDRSVAEQDVTLVTIFVNPLQFGASEDLSSYPRDLDADLALAEAAGERDPARVRALMAELVAAEPLARLDYAEVVDADTLQEVDPLAGNLRLLAAARFGRARLIDNVGATVGPAPTEQGANG